MLQKPNKFTFGTYNFHFNKKTFFKKTQGLQCFIIYLGQMSLFGKLSGTSTILLRQSTNCIPGSVHKMIDVGAGVGEFINDLDRGEASKFADDNKLAGIVNTP